MRVTTGPERNGGPFLERLVATVAARSVLWEVIALAGEAPQMSDEALRARLIMMLSPLWRGTSNVERQPCPVTPGLVPEVLERRRAHGAVVPALRGAR